MLGEKIAVVSGKRVLRRVISVEPLSVEVTFESTGKLLGVNATEVGTYTSTMQPDGSLHGEGQGALMTEDGGMVTWKGAGVGAFKEKGAVSYRGAVYYRTASPQFAKLNRIVGVFEFESGGDGQTRSETWEWK